MTLVLDDEQTRRLEEKARQFGIDPQALAIAAVNEFISQPDDAFEKAAQRTLEKKRELYRRLSQ